MDICSISATMDKCEIKDNNKISKFRNYASQIYAVLATNIVKLAAGSTIGFTSVLIAELYKEDAEIYASVSQVTLFSSYCFMGPIGSLAVGMLSQLIGNRLAMLLAVTFFAISFLIFHFATNASMLLGAQALVGFFSMISVGPGITYVVEITQPQLRSALTASATFTSMSAAFLIVLLSNFLHWRTIALLMLVFPIMGFVAVCTIPESPHWLASKNKLKEAEAALSWLRGWTTTENVVIEYNALKETYKKTSQDSDFSPRKNPTKISFIKENIRTYMHRSFYIPLSLICLLFILHHCTGYSPLLAYCIVIFRQINAPIDPHVAASIFDALRIIGALLCILSINHTGKKRLVYISLIGAASMFFIVSIALILKEYKIYTETCQWTAAIAMMLSTFLMSAGIDKIVFILNAELFPTKYRNVGAGIGLFVGSISGAVMNKIFLSLVDAVTLSGVFLIFGISSVITCAVFHFMFVETEGKTLQEIEAHYGGEKQLEKQRKSVNIPVEVNSV